MAFDAAGEVLRRRGDLPGAEAAFARAHELGYEPQPGRALVQLARGQTEAAAAALRLALASGKSASFRRARLLAAHAEVSIATEDLERAAGAVAELESLAERLQTDAVRATAAGALRRAEGDAEAAVSNLRRAVTAWQGLGAPYEAALKRELLARAASRAGDTSGARLELEIAHAVFARLDAMADVR